MDFIVAVIIALIAINLVRMLAGGGRSRRPQGQWRLNPGPPPISSNDPDWQSFNLSQNQPYPGNPMYSQTSGVEVAATNANAWNEIPQAIDNAQNQPRFDPGSMIASQAGFGQGNDFDSSQAMTPDPGAFTPSFDNSTPFDNSSAFDNSSSIDDRTSSSFDTSSSTSFDRGSS